MYGFCLLTVQAANGLLVLLELPCAFGGGQGSGLPGASNVCYGTCAIVSLGSAFSFIAPHVVVRVAHFLFTMMCAGKALVLVGTVAATITVTGIGFKISCHRQHTCTVCRHDIVMCITHALVM